ncbi:DUF883 family protein [Litoreibacter albidus]|uniref:Membrane-anchored ribosome-binding protein, inhibits growth in stationary phase, ElaB/YqjD/DUF883 family n=1 Tax=Litoreibacter albidus TaxID=670155 RepID=A0A1H3BTC7_9RHOB|nr:DUF883 family protein [Litoreibacter albidus]SDX44991.1 Membrane-anchored ribosome-binding protein, inhibits growth in stationary phase, ElaB/YqjD/DUF883 family [Litoreibacter albidus]
MARSSSKIEQLNTADAEDVSAQIAALKADLSGLTNAIASMGKGKAAELSDAANASAEAARAKGAEHLSKVRDQAAELQNQANDFVTKQPATALAIAAGAGFLIGMISNRR